MNILSLFDGCGIAYQALKELNINVDNYFASEIDKYAISVAKKQVGNKYQFLGDIEACNYKSLPKIDLLIAGFPCQDLSIAGKKEGLKGRKSGLFYKAVEILEQVNPKYFLFENVASMSKENKQIITDILKVEPIMINSALLTAQQRKRLYWTNIKGIEQPQDENILLKDILHEETSEYIKMSKKGVYKKNQDKASCLTGGGHSGGNHSDMDLIGMAIDINGHDFLRRIYSKYGKSPTLTSVTGGNQERKIAINFLQYRRLTPIECERLQGLPDNYTEGVSNSQRYKMIGNGFTVPVIKHILSNMEGKYG